MKKFIVFILIVLLAGGGFFYYKQNHGHKDAAERVVSPTHDTIEQVVTAQGKLEAKDYVDVGAQVSGQLKKLHPDVGADVKKGDTIADLDDRIYQSKIDGDEAGLKTLHAQLTEQQANVVLAQQEYDRNAKLYKVKAVSQDVLQTSENALKVAKARVASLQAQIEQSTSELSTDKTNLGFTKIYSPIDGTVVSQSVREGQTLNANQTAPVIVQVDNLNIMTVRA